MSDAVNVSPLPEVAERDVRQAGLAPILEKVVAGARLDRDEGLALFAAPLRAVGHLANAVRERLHGDRTYFVRDHHLNPTNVCRHACTFCAFARRKKDGDAYTMDLGRIEEEGARMAALDVREVHVVGGVHPDWGYEVYLDVVRALRRHLQRPRVGIKAWTAVEVDHMADLSGLSLERVMADLRDAGVDHLAGGGAEIFAPEVRKRLCASKADGARWLEVHRAAHAIGVPTNATMLYGHIERAEHRVDHLLALREVQDEALRARGLTVERVAASAIEAGFSSFIPLKFHPDNTRLAHLPGPSLQDDLRTLAASRLLLDNVPHVKAYWVMIGPDAAQLSLAYGVDDMNGTVIRERITRAAGGKHDQGLTKARITRLIVEAGRAPVERDARYAPITTGGGEGGGEGGAEGGAAGGGAAEGGAGQEAA